MILHFLQIVVHLILKMLKKLKDKIEYKIRYINNKKLKNLKMIIQMRNQHQLLLRLQLLNINLIKHKLNKLKKELKKWKNIKNKLNNNNNQKEKH